MVKITILNEELNRIRDLFNDDVNQMWLGTGTVLESATDTGLIHPVGTTLSTVSKSVSDKLVTYNYSLSSVIANGTTFAEAGLLGNGTAIDVNRVTYFPLTKANTEEYDFSTTFFITQS